MASNGKRPIVAGLTLIAVGMAFILDNIYDVGFSWQLIMIVIGIALAIQATDKRRRGAIFPGVLMILLGFIFLADEMMWLPWGFSKDWPLFILAVGTAFIVSFLFQREKKGLLIPGAILLGLGAIFMAAEYRYIRWSKVEDVLEWWPIILLLLGVYLLIKRNRKDEEDVILNPSKPETVTEKNETVDES